MQVASCLTCSMVYFKLHEDAQKFSMSLLLHLNVHIHVVSVQAVGDGQGASTRLQSLRHPTPAKGIILIGDLPTMNEWITADSNGGDDFVMPHLEVGNQTMFADNTRNSARSQESSSKK